MKGSTTELELSAEQEAIVHAPLVSARVAAGAGTGKTTTISRRVRHLVETGTEPERILGITFTNKAAQELADRIRTALDDLVETGREVTVHTYHGFASALLREFGAIVDVERDTELITPAFSRQILADITRSLPYRAFDPTVRGAIEKVRRLSAQLSDNLTAPADVTLPAALDGPWPERAELLVTLEAYEQRKRELGVADFGDLINRAHRLVDRHRDVATAIAERFDAVLLDEYQDTDPGQRELLRVLFGSTTPVMAVGDADQTIYEWRGASKENFEQFSNHFRFGGTAEFPLSLNRRSGAAILTAANAVRDRIDSTDRLPLSPVEGSEPGRVVTAVLPTAVAEADWIAEQIAELADDGLAWSDMAVLFRKNKDMLLVHDALARHGIPFEVANLGGLLSVPEIGDLHAWLRVLDRPEDSVGLTRLLVGARFRLGMADLACLTRWVRARHPDARDAGEHDQLVPYTFLEAIDQLEAIEGLDQRAKDSLLQFRSEYRHLLTAAQGSALVELCREILDHTGAWGDIDAMPSAARRSARLNLHRFLDLAEDWSPLAGRPSLGAFLVHLDDLETEGSEELDTARLSEADAVTLITVHRAKGLEWPAVFLPAVYDRNFPSGSSLYDDPFKFASFLPVEYRLDESFRRHTDPDEYREFVKRRHREQEWRIAYVATTRAKRFLAVSHAWWNGVEQTLAKPSRPSELFSLIDAFAERVVDADEPETRPERMHYRSGSEPAPDPLFPSGPDAALRSALEDAGLSARMASEQGVDGGYDRAVQSLQQTLFEIPEPLEPAPRPDPATSVTGLVTYARCPRRYYWGHVDPLPRRANPAAALGTEVHRRIELHHLGVVPLTDSDDVADPLDRIDPRDSGESGRAGRSPFDVFERSRFAGAKPAMVETPFEYATDAGLRLRGRIDAVYHHDPGWEVVDFKSGRPRAEPALDVQLQTYALAMTRHHPLDDESLAVTFAYLGGGELTESTESVTDEWLDGAQATVERLAADILAEHFDPIPSPACVDCEFTRFCPPGRAFLEQMEPETR